MAQGGEGWGGVGKTERGKDNGWQKTREGCEATCLVAVDTSPSSTASTGQKGAQQATKGQGCL